SDSQTVAPTSITVTITEKGKLSVNNKPMSSIPKVKREVRSLLADQKDKKDATITIVAEKNVPWKKVEDVMSIASNLRMRAILATKPIK
ncbi:MAG TPA: biopolymer transporter ExbD, partial [Phaeodactylibacter sp.]|nr:biopolymer transporter ExbD [Phaeodactylibacter sp.]